MSDPIVPSFPLMLLNAGAITWVPFHRWNESCLFSYKRSRLDCIGSLYSIPAHYRQRSNTYSYHQSHAAPDAKGRWALVDDLEQPVLFADLHRYDFGYQSDLLYIHEAQPPKAGREPSDWLSAVAVVVSGAMLSSGSDVLRVVVVKEREGLEPFWEWGKTLTLHQMNRRMRELTAKSSLALVPKQVLEILPHDWWEREPGKALKPQLRYIEVRRRLIDGEAEAKRKKPTPVRRKGLLRRLFFPFSK